MSLITREAEEGAGTRAAPEVRVWLLAQRVAFDQALFVLGVFSHSERAKLAAAGHVGSETELSWRIEEWEVGWQSQRASVLWRDQGEAIPLEFWVIPFLLNASEEGSQMIHRPSSLAQLH
jgi:hypothetical protein